MNTTKTLRLSDGNEYILTIMVKEDYSASLIVLQVGNNGKLGNFSISNDPQLQLMHEPKQKLFSTELEAKEFLDKMKEGDSPTKLL